MIDGDVIGHRIVSSIYLSADSTHESSSHFLDILLVATPACNPTISSFNHIRVAHCFIALPSFSSRGTVLVACSSRQTAIVPFGVEPALCLGDETSE